MIPSFSTSQHATQRFSLKPVQPRAPAVKLSIQQPKPVVAQPSVAQAEEKPQVQKVLPNKKHAVNVKF